MNEVRINCRVCKGRGDIEFERGMKVKPCQACRATGRDAYAERAALEAECERLADELDRKSVITGDYIARCQRLAAERDALAAKVERVRALHRAFGIYDECDCDDPDPATHLDVDGVGLTCNLMYRACAECCRDDVYQTEGCASYHAHRLDEDYPCPTIRALDEEPQP